MHQSTAAVPTENASRYLQQLAKHWAHSMPVEFTSERAAITFPRDLRGANWPEDALFTMEARPTDLLCRIEGSAEDQLETLKGVVERHLDRFAFREAPLSFQWSHLA